MRISTPPPQTSEAEPECLKAAPEIQDFLTALQSYAKRFVEEPELSFEQYYMEIASLEPKEIVAPLRWVKRPSIHVPHGV